jgi:hypothetical protein
MQLTVGLCRKASKSFTQVMVELKNALVVLWVDLTKSELCPRMTFPARLFPAL